MPKYVRYSGQAREWLDNQPLFISGSVKAVIEQVAAGNIEGRDWQVAQMDDPFYTTPMGRAKRIKMQYRAYNTNFQKDLRIFSASSITPNVAQNTRMFYTEVI